MARFTEGGGARMDEALMASEIHLLTEAIGGLKADVRNIDIKLQGFIEESTDEHRKVHDIVVATSESIRNVTRRLDAIEPLTEDYREKRAEARGAARLAGWLYTAAGVVGGLVVYVLGKAADWMTIRPHP